MKTILMLLVLVTLSGCTQQQYQKTQTEHSGWSPLFTDLSGCEEKEVTFTAPPIDIGAIIAVEPQGELTDIVSGHITPGDHIGFQYPLQGKHNVYAISDGVLKRVERNKNFPFVEKSNIKNYHLYFEYSCSVFGSYVHVTELDPIIVSDDKQLQELDLLPDITGDQSRNINVNIPARAGQRLGATQTYGLLGMLTVDTNVRLNFVNVSKYKSEPWKTHAVPAFDYFTEPIRSQLLAKNPRTKEPRGGKIDFDADGKLVGNWFLQGSEYRSDMPAYCGDYLCPYWDTHLAFVYDFVDPDQIRVSIGYDTGIQARGPYGVKGNAPDPAYVGVNSLVKYELVALEDIGYQFGYVTTGKALYTRNSDSAVGTMLIQMLDSRTIRVEVFPGKTADQVVGFTGQSRIYQR